MNKMNKILIVLIISDYPARYCVKVKPTVENLRESVGQKLFYVSALGAQTFIQSATLTGVPYRNKNIGLFIPVKIDYDWGQYDSYWSLNDCNVVPNNYNHHQLFYCKVCAENYMNKCKRENITFQPFITFAVHRDYLPYFHI